MSRTPDKPEISAIKVTRMQRSERTVTQYRGLQTDRKTQQKSQNKVKSPLMLIILLKKKIRSKMEHSFMRINIYKNKSKFQKIVTQYLSSILKFKIKTKQINVIQKLHNNRRRSQHLKVFLISLSSWIRNKQKNIKIQAYNMISQLAKLKTQKNQQTPRQPVGRIPMRDSKASTSIKKQDTDRSVEIVNKSVSASKINLSKKITFGMEGSNLPEQVEKIRKQNQQLKLMELSEDAREALKKVQRFDRFIYAKQTQKICKDVLAFQLKRLQKIKNSQKEMRVQYYDNQLTITALFNHIKLISQMNRDLQDLSKVKQRFEAEDLKKKQEQFKANLQSKRNKNKPSNTQTIIKQLTTNIEASLQSEDYQKARVDLNTLLSKYQKDQLIKQKLLMYRALSNALNKNRETEKNIEDFGRIANVFRNLDFCQTENNSKTLKQLQKQISMTVNKISKQADEQTLNIYSSFETLNQQLLQLFQAKVTSQKDKSKSNGKPEKGSQQLNKKIVQLQKELEAAKSSSTQAEQLNKIKTQFEKKVNIIIKKIEDKADYKKDFENLKKDKQFTDKPFEDFFRLSQALSSASSQQVNILSQSITNYFTTIVEIYGRQKVKPEQRSKQIRSMIQSESKKNPALLQLLKSFESVITTVTTTVTTEFQQKDKNGDKSVTQQIQKLRAQLQQSKASLKKSGQRIKQLQTSKFAVVQKQKKQAESGKKHLTSNKSMQLPKNQPQTALHTELKQSKQKILTLQKQLSTLKKQRQLSQKKQTKAQDPKKLQQQLKKLQQQIKLRKQKQAKQNVQKNKQASNIAVVNKSVTVINSVLENRNYKQLQIQVGKIVKGLEKDQRFGGLVGVISGLAKLVIQRENQQAAKKKQLDTSLQSQAKDKQKIQLIAKITKQSEAEIKSGAYLTSPDYWDKYLTGIDLRTGAVIKDTIKILKLLTNQIRVKNQKLEQTVTRNKTEATNTNLMLDLVKNIEAEIGKKQFFKSDDAWVNVQSSFQSQDRVVKSIFRLVKRFTDASRLKLNEERKASEKSIKSYEGQLQKMNNFISQYEIKLKQEQKKYQQLYKSFIQLQKQSGLQQNDDNKKSTSSLRGSRRSVRSSSSDKDTEIKNIKASIQSFAQDQKNMLQRLEMAEHERVALVQRINYLQNDLNSSFRTIEQQRQTIKTLQKNLSQQHAHYQKQYQTWKQKNISQTKQLQTLRDQHQKQFQKRQQQLVFQFENISKQRQIALQKYHKQLSNVQIQLNKQIEHLREQLRLKNVEVLRNQDFQKIRKNYDVLVVENNMVKEKLGYFQSQGSQVDQVNIQLQGKIRENGQLQAQVTNLNSKIRISEQEISNLNTRIRTSDQQIANLNLRIRSFEQQISNLNSKLRSSEQEIANLNSKTRSLSQQTANPTKIRSLQQEISNLNTKLRSSEQQISNLTSRLRSPEQQVSNLSTKLRSSQQQISNLTSRLRSQQQQSKTLRTTIQKLQTDTTNLQSKIRTLQSQLRTSKSTTTTTTMPPQSQLTQSLSKIKQLQLQITKLKSQQEQTISRQINTALRNQQQDFNRFLVGHDQQIQQHFFTIVIPSKIKQATSQSLTNTNTSTNTNTNIQLTSLKTNIRNLQSQLQQRNKTITQLQTRYQNQIKLSQELENKLNEEIRKIRNSYQELENKVRVSTQQEDRIRRYLVQLQITWDQAITGNLSEKTTMQYLRSAAKVQTREVVKEVVKSDPRQQATINQLRLKVDQLNKKYRQLQQNYYNEQNEKAKLLQSTKNISDYRILQDNLRRTQQNLDQINRKYTQQVQTTKSLRIDLTNFRTSQSSHKEQLRRIQSSWQQKYNQLTITTQKRIYQIQQKSLSLSSSRTQDTQKSLQHKLQQLTREKQLQISSLTNEINVMRDKCNDYSVRLADKEKYIIMMDQNFRNEAYEIQMNVVRHFQDKIGQYERRIAEHSVEIANVKASYANSSVNFNHHDCEKRYRELQDRANREINQLKVKVAGFSKQGRSQVELLKEVINNQKNEFKQLESMANNFRISMEEAHKQKQAYFNQLKTLSSQKQKQLFKIRSQYQNRISVITLQKSSLQARLSLGQQSRQTDSSTNIKLVQLETQLANKTQDIKNITQISQRRRRELQQEHQKHLATQRECQHLRLSVNKMENHIMRLQADISYFSSEIHKYKMALIETQSRESILRNDLMRIKTQSDDNSNNSSAYLKKQITTLKDQIIRITTLNITQIQNLHPDNPDPSRILKYLHQFHPQSSLQSPTHQSQLIALKKISQQVTQLISTNRQLQLKCTMLQSQLLNNGEYSQNVNILLLLQERMQLLMQFLMQKLFIDVSDGYSKYLFASREILAVQDVKEYLDNWLSFVKSLFLTANDIKSEELRHKAEEMLELKEQMNQILDKHIEFVEDQNYQTLDKYKMIFSDIKILVREYINTRNEEYIMMIWRSLEPIEAN